MSDIIQQFARKYETCSSYRDEGTVTGSDGVIHFRTFFRRPTCFLFECTEEGKPKEGYCAVWWSESTGAHDYNYLFGARSYGNNLGLPMAAASGICSAAHWIPVLLIPTLGGRTLADLSEYSTLDDAVVDGHACFRISSISANDRDDLWIRKSDYALLKYEQELGSSPEGDEEVIKTVRALKNPNLLQKAKDLFPNTDTDQQPDPRFAIFSSLANNADALADVMRTVLPLISADARCIKRTLRCQNVVFNEPIEDSSFLPRAPAHPL